MKPLKFSIIWNKVLEGAFPEEELKDLDMSIEIKKLNMFEQEITFNIYDIENDNPVEIAFHFGMLINQLVVNRKS